MSQHEEAMRRAVGYMNAASEMPVGSAGFRNAVAAGSAWRQIAAELRIAQQKRAGNYANIDVAAPQVVIVTPASVEDEKPEDDNEADFSSFGARTEDEMDEAETEAEFGSDAENVGDPVG